MTDDDPVGDAAGHGPPGSFSLLLNRGQLAIFGWLVLGHVLFVAGLFAVYYWGPAGLSLITPLFALPLLAFGSRDRLWAKALVMLPGFAAAHYAAIYVTVQVAAGMWTFFPGVPGVPGALGGLIGGLASLLLCVLFRLTRRDGQTVIWTLLGTLLLTLTGAVGVHMYGYGGSASDGLVGEVLQMLRIYTPWQIVFAYVLAKLLK